MKKLACCLFVAVLMCSQFVLSTCAVSDAVSDEPASVVVSETVEYLEDGTRIVTVIEEDIPSAAARSTTYTKTGSRTNTALNADDEVLWTFTVRGTFTVEEGVSATCTAASYSYTTPGSGWSLKSGSATKSANKAIGNGVFVQKVLGITIRTMETTCTLTCSKTGVLS